MCCVRSGKPYKATLSQVKKVGAHLIDTDNVQYSKYAWPIDDTGVQILGPGDALC
jgi:hypothetical protein